MKIRALLFLFITCLVVNAGLSFKLPPKAKYTASEKTINEAKRDLTNYLVGDATTLTNLFVRPTICGPGLWNVLKDSPHFSKPPLAKSTVKIPLPDG